MRANKQLAEAQKRMARLPGAAGMLRGLTRFDGAARWSVSTALQSRLFEAHRCAPGGAVASDLSAPGPTRTCTCRKEGGKVAKVGKAARGLTEAA